MVENKKLIDSSYISELFGLESQFYSDVFKFLEDTPIQKDPKFVESLNKWKLVFKQIYGEEIDRALFLKHLYFNLVLKLVLLIKLSTVYNLSIEESYQRYVENSYEVINFDRFDYFNWLVLPETIFKDTFSKVNKIPFVNQDLFHDLYQQLFLSTTRHTIGEFYTTINLAKMMVEKTYNFGLRVLDPSCGSGNFLMEIVVSILNSKKDDEAKIEAINNVYGFDINPLAILTAEINLSILLLNYFSNKIEIYPMVRVFLIDSLFPNQFETNSDLNLKEIYNSFDLIIGNPPWITYKDLFDKSYQTKIRNLANQLGIKPPSQYITHIELASIFFYGIPLNFLKINGKIFFVITKSVLNGDHCFKFRSFSIFDELEVWDFPDDYFFNINHICLMARYIGHDTTNTISKKYPIKAKIFNNNINFIKETSYTSIEIRDDGASIILPESDVNIMSNLSESYYKDKFFQGATLVPRTLVFFQIDKKLGEYLIISSDKDILTRTKKNWNFKFSNIEIEKRFKYKTFLNKDLIPFQVKLFRNVFLPVNPEFQFDEKYLSQHPKAHKFYKKMNEFYQKNKKETSDINTLFANLNYWNKLTKQFNNKPFIVVYNASGSSVKSAVLENNKRNLIIASENYYYSTDFQYEAYYLSAILNSQTLSKFIKMIKSSRHIHKRPFRFPIPSYNDENELHRRLATKGKKYHSVVQDLVSNNKKITPEKIRTILHHKLVKIDDLTKKVVFS